MTQTVSSITRVAGFRAVGVACGVKDSGKPDLALIVGDQLGAAAAVFTRNLFKAAPVLYDVELLKRNQARLQGVVINAGNANAITGAQGLQDAERMARLTESVCDLPADSVLVMSTGVIGHTLSMSNIERGIRLAGEAIRTESGLRGQDAARAIMTTDLVPKEAFVQTTVGGHTVCIGGMAKGSGMIHPDMATLLSVIVTDAVLEPDAFNLALKQAVDRSFNRITVDGDTSTNDTVLSMTSALAGNEPIAEIGQREFQDFVGALIEVCTSLAKMIARDGEGATKLVEIRIRGAANDTEAELAAKTVATSPLVKTALFGNDPNWGRTLAAIGRSSVEVEPRRVSLRLGGFNLVKDGEPVDFDVAAAQEWLSSSAEIVLEIDLNLGRGEATVWTCDLSYGYIEINAEYHT